MSKHKNAEEAALEYIVDWVPKSIDIVVNAIGGQGGLPGKKRISSQEESEMAKWRSLKEQGLV